MVKNTVVAGLCCAALSITLGCGDTNDVGSGPEILPSVSPIQLGDLWPQGNEEQNLGSIERTPYEFVLLLQSTGDETLEIEEVCLIGDTSNFIVEGPVPSSVRPGDEAGVRITYSRQSPGSDRILVGVRSNADNFPGLTVPMCARVVADGNEKNTNVPLCEFPEDQVPELSELCR